MDMDPGLDIQYQNRCRGMTETETNSSVLSLE